MSDNPHNSGQTGQPSSPPTTPQGNDVQIDLDDADAAARPAPPSPPPIMTTPPDTSVPFVGLGSQPVDEWGPQHTSIFHPAAIPNSQETQATADPTTKVVKRTHDATAEKRRAPRAMTHNGGAADDANPDEAVTAAANSTGDEEARRRRNEDRKKRRKERAAAEHVRQLEEEARRLFIWGFFALPLLWLISLIYFYKEHADENASQIIKKYYIRSLFMFIIYTIIFVAWFIAFQLNSNASLSALNILSFKGQSPSRF